jgi:hypothetical protein
VGRAITTAVGVGLVGRPVLAILRRAATRAAFSPAVEARDAARQPGARPSDPAPGESSRQHPSNLARHNI